MAINKNKMTNFIGQKFKDDGINNIPTPPIAIQALNHVFPLKGLRIWEPACGEGYMVRTLEKYGAEVTGTDIRKGKKIYGVGGKPFESFKEPPSKFDAIVTNPPYGISFHSFLEHACKVSVYVPVYLLTQNTLLMAAWPYPFVTCHLEALHFLAFPIPFLDENGEWKHGGFKHVWSRWGPKKRSAIITTFIYKNKL